MNKTFRNIIYIALTLVALTSCNDWLDRSHRLRRKSNSAERADTKTSSRVYILP